MTNQTFTFSVIEHNREFVAKYWLEGIYHVFSSPDVLGAAFFAEDKDKAYEGFVIRLKELIR